MSWATKVCSVFEHKVTSMKDAPPPYPSGVQTLMGSAQTQGLANSYSAALFQKRRGIRVGLVLEALDDGTMLVTFDDSRYSCKTVEEVGERIAVEIAKQRMEA